MNDFSDLEKELRKLRPAQPSPVLFDRVGEALKHGRLSVSDAKRKRWRFREWSRRVVSDIDGQPRGNGERAGSERRQRLKS